MDYEKAKLRIDLDALVMQLGNGLPALRARVNDDLSALRARVNDDLSALREQVEALERRLDPPAEDDLALKRRKQYPAWLAKRPKKPSVEAAPPAEKKAVLEEPVSEPELT